MPVRSHSQGQDLFSDSGKQCSHCQPDNPEAELLDSPQRRHMGQLQREARQVHNHVLRWLYYRFLRFCHENLGPRGAIQASFRRKIRAHVEQGQERVGYLSRRIARTMQRNAVDPRNERPCRYQSRPLRFRTGRGSTRWRLNQPSQSLSPKARASTSERWRMGTFSSSVHRISRFS